MALLQGIAQQAWKAVKSVTPAQLRQEFLRTTEKQAKRWGQRAAGVMPAFALGWLHNVQQWAAQEGQLRQSHPETANQADPLELVAQSLCASADCCEHQHQTELGAAAADETTTSGDRAAEPSKKPRHRKPRKRSKT